VAGKSKDSYVMLAGKQKNGWSRWLASSRMVGHVGGQAEEWLVTLAVKQHGTDQHLAFQRQHRMWEPILRLV
jgi:hypothetical protein